jgi:HrpA-like RNA helicase
MQPGKCFRLITESKFNSLEEYAIPEMQRTEISGAILQLKALGIDDVLHFDFLSSPPSESMIYSFELLYSLGALDDNCKLTEMGEKMSGKLSCTYDMCDNISSYIYHTCT